MVSMKKLSLSRCATWFTSGMALTDFFFAWGKLIFLVRFYVVNLF